MIKQAALAALLFSGCSAEHDGSALWEAADPEPVQVDGHSDRLAEKIKQDADSFREIYDTAVVKGTEYVIVAYKVKHMSRFQMKNIEQKIDERMEKLADSETADVIVSSDYKIFLEVVRLKEDIEAGHVSKQEANKRIESIVALKKETA